MTHGEELSSEMQQDSIVLTYLEGLLMHQAASGSGTAVDKHTVGRAKTDENFKISGSIFSNSPTNASVHKNSPSQGSGMLHLKKARLLQSSEDWNAAKRRRLSDSMAGINGNNETLLAGMVENVPKGKQDSTLLASLLQSFSSRLQSVALTQQIKQSLKDQGFSIGQEPIHEDKDSRCFGVASNHLKTILNKSRSKEKVSDDNITGLIKNSHQDKFIEPTLKAQTTSKASAEPVSCAARLQAVANMVVKRSSPTASPKPSVACSQLALLLSSEAHLQQYSREHALKAQTASQLASERLAAMARLKESSETDLSCFQLSTNLPTRVNSPVRPLSNGVGNVGHLSHFPNHLGVPNSPLKTVGYKNHAERNHAKPSPNNSLLLHLLKSQNATSVSTSQSHSEKYSFEQSTTPTTTTDDFSDNNPSFTEEETSDDESTHSNCVPIDLSFKNRVVKPEALSTASIDNLTESLLQNWDPKVEGLDLSRDKDTPMDSTLKPYQKVTLLQLLLGHKIDETPESIADLRGPPPAADLTKLNLSGQSHILENTSIRGSSPISNMSLHNPAKADSPVNLAHQPFSIKPNFTSYIGSLQSERLMNPASKHLVELTRNKAFHSPVPLPINSNAQSSDSFSASKLLQNLAQCGMHTAAPEERLNKTLNASNGKTVGLVDRLSSPHVAKPSGSVQESKVLSSPSTPMDSGFPSSEIENLLERRTVLQLLLGTTNKGKNEKVQRTVVKDESFQNQSDKITSEQIIAFKIKTEQEDESNAQHFKDTGVPSPMGLSLPKTARSSPEDTKPQHLSPHEFSGSRNGLLSRLLRQNHDGYDTNDLDINRHCEMKLNESKIPCVVPKKRKMLQNQPTESQIKLARISTPDTGNKPFCPMKSLCPPVTLQEDMNGNKADHERSGALVQSSVNEGKNASWSRESKGFNVLKQLLLSENCVRDLSHHRNHTSAEELLRHNRSNMAVKSDFLAPINSVMGKHSHANSIDQMTFPYPTLRNSPHPPPEVSGNKISMASPGPVNVSPVHNDKGPIKWVITGVDKNDFGKDSPKLTKTNPILYYMLQKGAQSAAGQGLRDRNIWTESLLAQSNELTFKRELAGGGVNGSNGFGFTRPSNHTANNTFHNSNGSKYGLYDMLTIKKEPE